MRTSSLFLAAATLLAGCGPFVPDPTAPGPGPDPDPSGPAVTIPFRLGSAGLEEGRGVAISGSGVILTGWFTSTLDFDPGEGAVGRTSFGAQDVAVARYGDGGDLDWVFTFGGAQAEVPTAIAATADGGAVVVGYGSGGGTCGGRVLTSAGGRDILVLKLSAAGVCDWGYLLGGPDNDEARAVAVAEDGSIYIAGSFGGLADVDPVGTTVLLSKGGDDGFLIRLTAAGELDGAVQGGGAGADRFSALALAPSGDVVVGGEFDGTASLGSGLAPVVLTSVGGTDGLLARYTSMLGLRWGIRLGGAGADRVNAVASDPSGDVLAAGSFEGSADLDPGPGTALVNSLGGADLFLARYAAATGVWGGLARSLGGVGTEAVSRMVLTPAGQLLLTGFFQETVDFDPGAGTRIVTARGTGGAGDAFLLALDQQGDFGWVVPLGAAVGGSGNVAVGSDLAVDGFGRVWITGRFFGRTDFDPGPDATELVAVSESDIFLSRYLATDGTLVPAERLESAP
jgi:hypothetical protein